MRKEKTGREEKRWKTHPAGSEKEREKKKERESKKRRWKDEEKKNSGEADVGDICEALVTTQRLSASERR